MQGWILSLIGVLCFTISVRGQDAVGESLRRENEIVRRERDVLLRERIDLKRRLAESEKEHRAELDEAKVEIDVLKAKLDRITDRLAQYQKTRKPLPLPAPLPSDLRGLVVGASATIPIARVSRKPGEPLKGTVTEISPTSTLVALSLGSEDGIRAGQELECYRLGSADGPPSLPLYIGKVRIVRVTPREAVAQYVPQRGLERRPMVGDEVASELLPK